MVTFFGGIYFWIFLELQKKFFSLVVRPLTLSGRATKKITFLRLSLHMQNCQEGNSPLFPHPLQTHTPLAIKTDEQSDPQKKLCVMDNISCVQEPLLLNTRCKVQAVAAAIIARYKTEKPLFIAVIRY